MANKKISALTAITAPPARNIPIPTVQGGTTKRMTIEELTGEYEINGTLTSAELLLLNTTPILAIAAPGAGYYIRILRADAWIDYNSAAYTTSTSIGIWYDTAIRAAWSFVKILESTIDTGEMAVLQDMVSAAQTLMLVNKAIYFKPFTATNPAAGNSDIKWRIRYEICAEL